MSNNKVVELLIKEAESSQASNAVFHVWALRERARAMVTLRNLHHTMVREGFNFDKQDYVRLFKVLASLGLAELDTDSKGRVRGLKKVVGTLYSIGQAACKQRADIEPFSPRNKFYNLVTTPEVIRKPVPVTPVCLNLQLTINGRDINIPLPKSLTAEEITKLMDVLKQA